MSSPDFSRLNTRVDSLRGELVRVISDLVRTPTVQVPPRGSEKKGQDLLATEYRKLGYETDLYDIGTIAALHKHPLRHDKHDIEDRWNLAVKIKGRGGGRSLVLNGHMDTVPPSESPWTRDPFKPVVEGGRIYGLGTVDMKASLAAMLIFARVLKDEGLALKGDLILESVCDEEDGGVHGTIAQRLRGYHADAAVVLEASGLGIFNMHKGGYFPEMTIQEPAAGINLNEEFIPKMPRMLGAVMDGIEDLAKMRAASAKIPPGYAHEKAPVPVWVLKVVSGLWGKSVPMAMASQVQILVYLLTVPGESMQRVRDQFLEWNAALSTKHPDLFPKPPEVTTSLRLMEPSFIPADHPLVTTLARSVEAQMGRKPTIRGSPAPCDMFAFNNYFNIPAVWFGPKGDKAHAADEYVELESVVDTVKCLLRFAGEWCGWE